MVPSSARTSVSLNGVGFAFMQERRDRMNHGGHSSIHRELHVANGVEHVADGPHRRAE